MTSKGHDQFKPQVQVFMLEGFQDGIGRVKCGDSGSIITRVVFQMNEKG